MGRAFSGPGEKKSLFVFGACQTEQCVAVPGPEPDLAIPGAAPTYGEQKKHCASLEEQ